MTTFMIYIFLIFGVNNREEKAVPYFHLSLQYYTQYIRSNSRHYILVVSNARI